MATRNSVDLHVGRRVRMRRMLIGMSQTELAKRIGLTFQQIQKYERGINRIGASRLYDIAGILQVPPSYFFQGLDGEPDAADGAPASEDDLASLEALQTIATRQGVELNRAFLKLTDPEIRRLIIELTRSIAEPGAGDGETGTQEGDASGDDESGGSSSTG